MEACALFWLAMVPTRDYDDGDDDEDVDDDTGSDGNEGAVSNHEDICGS